MPSLPSIKSSLRELQDFNFFPPQLVMCISLYGEKKNDKLDLEKSLRIDRMKELIKRQVKEMQMKENLLDKLNVLKS